MMLYDHSPYWSSYSEHGIFDVDYSFIEAPDSKLVSDRRLGQLSLNLSKVFLSPKLDSCVV